MVGRDPQSVLDNSPQTGSVLPPVIAFLGPTAVGKSGLALELAPRFGAEIISADSRQVYRYMDIGTAKPSLAEREAVPHYMIDVAAPDDPYSVQRYQREATRVLSRIAERGKVAFVAGGTGFYVRALLHGMTMPSVPPDPEFRARLRAEAETGADLHSRLAAVDPVSAERIHPNNLPRVIRALEIVYGLNGPVPQSPEGAAIPALQIGLKREREELHRIADSRICKQIDAGLVEETKQLLAMGYERDLPALDGLVYREMVGYVLGEMTLEEATVASQHATHRYIRRQMTWFRADPSIRWLEAGDARETAEEMIGEWLKMQAR